jgi:hypothetical protein
MTFTATMTTGPQRMQALERANAVRLKRAELKRKIADGHLSAADVILDLPWEAMSWPVGELLTSQRRWGSIRAHKLLAGLHISEMRPVGALTERQRRVVATRLGDNASQELSHLAPHPSDALELVGV